VERAAKRANPEAEEHAMARRNAKTSPPSIESYLFEVSIGDPSYGLSLADPKREPGLYSEHWHLDLEGRCIAPEALAGRVVRLLFIARRNYFEHGSTDPTWRPPGVGRLTMKKDQADYVGSLPYEAAWNVAIGVATGLFKYVHISGPPLKYGASHIRHLSFQARYDQRDYFD